MTNMLRNEKKTKKTRLGVGGLVGGGAVGLGLGLRGTRGGLVRGGLLGARLLARVGAVGRGGGELVEPVGLGLGVGRLGLCVCAFSKGGGRGGNGKGEGRAREPWAGETDTQVRNGRLKKGGRYEGRATTREREREKERNSKKD